MTDVKWHTLKLGVKIKSTKANKEEKTTKLGQKEKIRWTVYRRLGSTLFTKATTAYGTSQYLA